MLAEFRGCSLTKLNSLEFIEASMNTAAAEARATVVNSSFHKFGPQGISGVLVLAESHLSVHTWPEHGYFAADLFFCGGGDPYKAFEQLRDRLGAGHFQLTELKRGMEPRARGVEVES